MSKLQERRRISHLWLLAIVILITTILVVDWYTGADGVGATARFAVRFLRFAVESSWRLLLVLWERVGFAFVAILSSRVTRMFAALTLGMGVSYLTSDHKKVGRFYSLRAYARESGRRMKEWWQHLHFLSKSLIVVFLIVIQIYLHFWILLFPVGFLLAGMVFALKKTQGWLASYVFGAVYRTRFGAWHRRTVSSLKRTPLVGAIVGGADYVRLCFRGGWRLWRYDSQYRDAQGQLMHARGRWLLFKALLRGEWACYVGRPLLAGPRMKPWNKPKLKEAAE